MYCKLPRPKRMSRLACDSPNSGEFETDAILPPVAAIHATAVCEEIRQASLRTNHRRIEAPVNHFPATPPESLRVRPKI